MPLPRRTQRVPSGDVAVYAQALPALPIMIALVAAVPAAFARARAAAAIAVVASALALVVNALVLRAALTVGPQVYALGGWPAPQGIVLVADGLGATLALTASAVALAAALHGLATGEMIQRPLYHTMFLFLLAALCGAFYTGDLFNLYVMMEMVILSSIVLVAMAGRRISAEVTFKYAILSAIGSSALLLGITLVYASLGTLNMADISRRVATGEAPALLEPAAALMLAAFLLKAAILPFHFWQPDAHSAAPSAVSAMLSGVMVKVGVYGILRLSTLLFPGTPVLALLTPLGAVSALFGALAALANPDLKRLLAYSTISNVGFILMAIGWGGTLGLTAAVLHAVSHALIKGSLFLAGGFLAERFQEHSLRRLTGLASLAPGTAMAFGVGAIAIAGLPPTSGFISKLALLQAGHAAGTAPMLALMVLASGLSIAYAARLFALFFFGATPAWVIERSRALEPRPWGVAAAALLVLAVLVLGLWPEPLVRLAAAAAAELGQPDVYVAAVLGGPP